MKAIWSKSPHLETSIEDSNQYYKKHENDMQYNLREKFKSCKKKYH